MTLVVPALACLVLVGCGGTVEPVDAVACPAHMVPERDGGLECRVRLDGGAWCCDERSPRGVTTTRRVEVTDVRQ